jgi:hypothetical protein
VASHHTIGLKWEAEWRSTTLVNPLHQGISALAEQISFQASCAARLQSPCLTGDFASHRQRITVRICEARPGILSRAIDALASVATFTEPRVSNRRPSNLG